MMNINKQKSMKDDMYNFIRIIVGRSYSAQIRFLAQSYMSNIQLHCEIYLL